jgi:hypothetical protein
MEIANTKNFTKKIRDLVLDEKWVDRGKTRYGDCTDMAVQLMEKTEGQFVPVLGGGHASNVTPTDCKAGFLFARLPSKTRHPLKAHKRLRNAFARQELNSLGKATRLSIPKVVVKRPLHLVAKALSFPLCYLRLAPHPPLVRYDLRKLNQRSNLVSIRLRRSICFLSSRLRRPSVLSSSPFSSSNTITGIPFFDLPRRAFLDLAITTSSEYPESLLSNHSSVTAVANLEVR